MTFIERCAKAFTGPLFGKIKHGDEQHQAWLRSELEKLGPEMMQLILREMREAVTEEMILGVAEAIWDATNTNEISWAGPKSLRGVAKAAVDAAIDQAMK